MKVQSWMIKSWPTLQWYLPPEFEPPITFKHWSSHARDEVSDLGTRQGETVWVGRIDGQDAGLAWEWTEYRSGVVMLTDPNCIVSNIQFTDLQAKLLPPLAALSAVNCIVHSLNWQQAVCDTLRHGPVVANPIMLPSPALAWRTDRSALRLRTLGATMERAAA